MAAPYRIVKPSVPGTPAAAAAPGHDYRERLLKLIPAEVVALYLTFSGIVPADQAWGILLVALVCLLLVVLVRARGTADSSAGKSPQLLAVAIAALSFVWWVYGTSGERLVALGLPYVPWLASFLIGAWTLGIPYLYKGSSE